jgi:hypothetical protein
MVDAGKQVLQAERRQPGRCQLHQQGQVLEPTAQFGHVTRHELLSRPGIGGGTLQEKLSPRTEG